MWKKLRLALAFLLIAMLLVACGDPTATPATSSSSTTAAASGAATTAAASGAATTAAVAAATTAAAAAATTSIAQSAGKTPEPTLPPKAEAVTGVNPLPALPTAPAEAKKGGTLTLANSGPLATNIPATPTNSDVVGSWFTVTNLIWDSSLLQYNYTTLQWQLGMAKDFKVDAAGKVFTFTLRPDLKWSDGSPITPDDFVYTFEQISKPNKENPAANYARLADVVRITSYKGDNAANTVTITMAETYARDISLYFGSFWAVPKKVWEGKPYFDPANNPEIKKPSVVSGPFKIESYDPNAGATFVANSNWFRGKPNFDKVVMKPFAPNLIYEALKTGQVDATIDPLPPAQFNEIKGNQDLKTYEWYGAQSEYRYVVYNTTKAPMGDKALRQAIGYALDRSVMIKLAENSRAVPQYTFTNEVSPYFNPEVSRYDFSLDKAKKTLEDGGYKMQGSTLLGKDGQPVKMSFSHANVDVSGKIVATYAQAQLKQLGIDVSVEGKDPQSYLTGLVTKQYDVATGTTGSTVFPDPDTVKFFYIKDGVFNVAGFVNPRLDEIFKLGAFELDNAKRKALYSEAQKILTDELPSQVFYAQVPYIAANKKIGGIVPSKGGRIDLNSAVANWYGV